MNKISVHHLEKQFKGHQILNNISFQVQAGEVVALLGDSGAGKSTLLRCLNVLELPDAGSITVGDVTLDFSQKKSPASQPLLQKLRAKVGMVFQQYHLWAHMTILQNLIEAPMRVLKVPKSEAIDQAEALLQQVEIYHKKNDYPSQLSGGQQQRAAIARALMMRPEVMLFDEPTSALDPKMVSKMIKLIQMLAENGMTVVIATHEMKFAQELAHKTIFLHQGKVLEPQTQAFQTFIQTES